jgi:hypothetical protein
VPFELNIAVKRGPIEQRGRDSAEQQPPPRATVVEVSGALTTADAADLTQQLDSVVTDASSSVVVRFVGDVHVSADDVEAIQLVATWLKCRRRDGYSLYVDVEDANAREVFERVADIRPAMLPFGADPGVPRRNVDDPASAEDGDSA